MVRTVTDFAQAYIRYYTLGAKDDYWAVEELSALVHTDPENAWAIIREINAFPIDPEWRDFVLAGVGSGPLEALLVLHQSKFLDKILIAASTDDSLRMQLATMYESSVGPDVFDRIQALLQAS